MGVKPFEDSRIEVVHFLEVECVAGVVVEMSIAVRDGCGYFFTHPDRGEDVVLATDDQARLGDLSELIVHVVIDAGGGLTFEAVKRLRSWSVCETLATF